MAQTHDKVTFGNFLKPKMPGIDGISIPQYSAMVLAIIPLFILVATGMLIAALIWFIFAAAALSPWVLGTLLWGTNPYGKLLNYWSFKRAERHGMTMLLQGPLSMTSESSWRLPGLLATSTLVEAVDVYGNRFGIVVHPDVDEYVVAIEVHPDDVTTIDHQAIDRMAGHWGDYLALLSREPDITGAQVVVETVPDTGVRVATAASQERCSTAPNLALAVLDEVIEQAPQGSAHITTTITLTFSGRYAAQDASGKTQRRRLSVDEMADSIGTRLPMLLTHLEATGAGSGVRARTAADIIDATRTAFDPSVGADVDSARASGGTQLGWDEAGPSFAQARRGDYLHDAHTSMSWVMKEPTSGTFDATVLHSILAPHAQIERKRVAILYRPIDTVRSAITAEWRVTAASVDADSKRRSGPSKRSSAKLTAAQANAEAEAAGATFVRFGAVATITVSDEKHLPIAATTMTGLATRSRLQMRAANGCQDTAFVAGLPLGIVMPTRVALPSFLRG